MATSEAMTPEMRAEIAARQQRVRKGNWWYNSERITSEDESALDIADSVEKDIPALLAEVARLTNVAANSDALLQEMFGYVGELCVLSGVPEDDAKDIWSLGVAVKRLAEENARLRDAELVTWAFVNTATVRSDLPHILYKPCRDYMDMPGEIGDECRKAMVRPSESGRLFNPMFFFLKGGDNVGDGEVRIFLSAGEIPASRIPDEARAILIAARDTAAAARATSDAKETP